MKLCKDCKHFSGNIQEICQHPDAPRSPVYGHFDGRCGLLRSSNCLITPRCGQAGSWFEPKEEITQEG